MTDDRLRLYVERIERLNDEIAGLLGDRKDVYAEAKAVGYDPRTLRAAIKRRAVAPEARAEADALLEVYEAALAGMPSSSEALGHKDVPDAREDLRELALALLAEQIAGVGDPAQAAALAEHVAVILDIRAERRELLAAETARRALAAGEGFDKGALTRVVQWIEKCAKHGADAMRAGEAVFQMYRGSIEGRGVADSVQVSGDPKLQKLAGKRPSAKMERVQAWLATGMGD
jgi:uncharacterized protein (UPF0335 family)